MSEEVVRNVGVGREGRVLNFIFIVFGGRGEILERELWLGEKWVFYFLKRI